MSRSLVKRIFAVEVKELTQAERVFKRFGGARDLVRALKRAGFTKHASSVYRWNHSKKNGGTNGQIPTRAWPCILAAARLEGIFLTSEEFDPTSREVKERVAAEITIFTKREERKEIVKAQNHQDKLVHRRARLKEARKLDAELQKVEEDAEDLLA